MITELKNTEFIDYYNYNVDMKEYKDIDIKITGTAFGYNVYYIKDEYAKNWSINTDDFIRNTRGNKGIDTIIRYEDNQFEATTSIQTTKDNGNILTKKGKKYISDTDFIETDLSRCTNGNFKLSAGIDFTSMIADAFWATRLVRKMGEMSKKTQSVDLGEYIKARVYYGIVKGEPKIIIDILSLHPLDSFENKPDKLKLNGEEISYNLCKLIDEKFTAEHICVQPENPGNEILWSPPTDWIFPDKKEHKAMYNAAFSIKYGVYMWIGSNKSEPNKKYLYIGIVGTERNKKNTVGNRIFNQELKGNTCIDNGIDTIECFRYSELKNSGNQTAEQILQTVEMQCINNFSSFFGYNSISLKAGPEAIINNLFDGVFVENEKFEIQMINKKKRYNNTERK